MRSAHTSVLPEKFQTRETHPGPYGDISKKIKPNIFIELTSVISCRMLCIGHVSSGWMAGYRVFYMDRALEINESMAIFLANWAAIDLHDTYKRNGNKSQTQILLESIATNNFEGALRSHIFYRGLLLSRFKHCALEIRVACCEELWADTRDKCYCIICSKNDISTSCELEQSMVWT